MKKTKVKLPNVGEYIQVVSIPAWDKIQVVGKKYKVLSVTKCKGRLTVCKTCLSDKHSIRVYIKNIGYPVCTCDVGYKIVGGNK